MLPGSPTESTRTGGLPNHEPTMSWIPRTAMRAAVLNFVASTAAGPLTWGTWAITAASDSPPPATEIT